ncbi:MAG: DUF6339 family protein [Pseudoruminococcus massiliensis]|uniref:DUF6339 family protein n=1 Tax=Pseudoruminococcus massiliensis TaxID=2086583 RepID=UPI0039913634|nr:DUF6339 family protein [Oscillospiraceae bacterium]
MKIHFLKQNSLEALRFNIPSNIKHYKDSSNQWTYDYFVDENPFGEYKIEVEDFELINMDNPSKTDLTNSIIIYSAMKNISDTQATDERLWAGLFHSDEWKFLCKRWDKYVNMKPSEIYSRYFFGQDKKRSLFTNSLSRLWWVERLTYDSERKDPFELTKYFERNFSTKSLVIFSNNYMANINVTRGLITALKYIESEFSNICFSRELYYETTKYLNILGGTYILDYFSSDEIKEKIISYIINHTELIK